MKNSETVCRSIDIDEILKILPHRQPFLLIDRVLEYHGNSTGSRAGQKVRVVKNVTYNEPFFHGHFPHRAIMPGVLILESLAQAGAMACWKPSDPQMNVAIGRIGEAKFRRPVTPGDSLMIDAQVVKDRGRMVVILATAHIGDELVTEVEILAHISPRGEE